MNSRLFSNRNFLLHWLSTAIAQVGSFFTIVALPWLVLYITNNDPFIMATVMAVSSLPQGLFILFGGTLADKLSPLRVLKVSRLLFLMTILSLSLLVYQQLIPLWSIYIYALIFGILSGFCIPAAQSLLPSLLAEKLLGKANGVVMATMQFSQMLGPLLAGWLIWLGREISNTAEKDTDYVGLSLAFSLDGLAIFIALILMTYIKVPEKPITQHNLSLLKMMQQGLKFCWSDKAIRVVLSYLIIISFFLHGPLMAGIPIFTKVHLGLAEQVYGTLYAMIGLGALLGAGFAYMYKFNDYQMGIVVLICDLISGLGLFGLGHQTNPFGAGVALFIIGLCSGVIMVAGTTWFQLRTPGVLMGRVMAILMFAIVGLIPISSTLSGYFIKLFSVNEVMNIAGLLMIFFAGAGLITPYIRNMGKLPRADLDSVLPDLSR